MNYTDNVKEYYNNSPEREWNRFLRHPLEFPISYRMICRHLPHTTLNIVDIGGGPGRYAFKLQEDGHNVTLIDLSEGNIAYAHQIMQERNVILNDAIVGDACNLTMLRDNIFDVALLMGPLYHLFDKDQQKKAINEAKRVTKDKGIIVLVFLSIYGPIYDSLRRLPKEKKFTTIQLKSIINSRNTIGITKQENFPGAQFIDPDEIHDILNEYGFEEISIFGAESFMSQSDNRIKELEETDKDMWIEFGLDLCTSKPALYGSEHIVCIVRKADS